ncbi:hypothetical protein HDU86_000815 [Geranomyces michiganensis]|nr:hypothetical protein HDU86_000815 [Geranomyces michiganensis]
MRHSSAAVVCLIASLFAAAPDLAAAQSSPSPSPLPSFIIPATNSTPVVDQGETSPPESAACTAAHTAGVAARNACLDRLGLKYPLAINNQDEANAVILRTTPCDCNLASYTRSGTTLCASSPALAESRTIIRKPLFDACESGDAKTVAIWYQQVLIYNYEDDLAFAQANNQTRPDPSAASWVDSHGGGLFDFHTTADPALPNYRFTADAASEAHVKEAMHQAEQAAKGGASPSASSVKPGAAPTAGSAAPTGGPSVGGAAAAAGTSPSGAAASAPFATAFVWVVLGTGSAAMMMMI